MFASPKQLRLARRLDIASRGRVVAEGFEKGSLVGTGAGQLDEGLEDLIKQNIALETARVEVIVDLDLVSGVPEVHELVHLVDERHGPSARRFEAEIAAPASVPGFELYPGTASAARFIHIIGRVLIVSLVAGSSLARLGQEIVLIHQGRV